MLHLEGRPANISANNHFVVVDGANHMLLDCADIFGMVLT